MRTIDVLEKNGRKKEEAIAERDGHAHFSLSCADIKENTKQTNRRRRRRRNSRKMTKKKKIKRENKGRAVRLLFGGTVDSCFGAFVSQTFGCYLSLSLLLPFPFIETTPFVSYLLFSLYPFLSSSAFRCLYCWY